MKRGLTYSEAMDYVGAKRRTFDELWRPRLVAMPVGSSLIFDRQDLDKLFEQFKQEAAGAAPAANDDVQTPAEQNGARNGRPISKKGFTQWAKKQPGSTRTKTEVGTLTSGTEAPDFASVVFSIKRKRKAG